LLRSYTARFHEWGEGSPLVLIPGLAGGPRLLCPLGSALSRRFRVLSYALRGEHDFFALRQRFGVTDLIDDLSELLDAGH
jgi:pimeloyl-ACP methyl ester carboxylesterase